MFTAFKAMFFALAILRCSYLRGTVDGEWNLGNRLVPMPQLPAPESYRDDADDEIESESADDHTS